MSQSMFVKSKIVNIFRCLFSGIAKSTKLCIVCILCMVAEYMRRKPQRWREQMAWNKFQSTPFAFGIEFIQQTSYTMETCIQGLLESCSNLLDYIWKWRREHCHSIVRMFSCADETMTLWNPSSPIAVSKLLASKAFCFQIPSRHLMSDSQTMKINP